MWNHTALGHSLSQNSITIHVCCWGIDEQDIAHTRALAHCSEVTLRALHGRGRLEVGS